MRSTAAPGRQSGIQLSAANNVQGQGPERDPITPNGSFRSGMDARRAVSDERDPQTQRFCAVPARPGDQHAIHRFLVSIFHQPSAAEFQAQLEDPFYEPTDRLVIKRGERILGHARLTKREMRFGGMGLPIAGLADVAVLPEFHGQGCGFELLGASERRMVEEGALLGVIRTKTPQFFMRHGWTVCMRHSYSVAGARDILSQLREQEAGRRDPLQPDIPALNIRLWRHVEQAALMRLYAENTKGVCGPLVRSEAYWRWLISRRAYDRIYVAIEGPDKLELDEALTPIVGYAVMKEARIVELMTSLGHPHAAPQLLARACRDAIEHDLHYVRLDAAPDDPLHRLFAQAGGQQRYHEAENGEVFLVRLFDPRRFLALLENEILRRAKEAELALPCELALQASSQKHLLVVRRRSVKIKAGKLGRSYLELGEAELVQLLLGHLDVASAVGAGRLAASTRQAVETASILFPQLPLWRPPLDDLPA